MTEPSNDTKERIPLWLWPNVLGLDAPLVAVAWQYFFAAAGRLKIPALHYLTLGIVVWVIYSADRLFDSRHLQRMDQAAQRHRFYQRNFKVMLAITIAIALIGAALVLTVLPLNFVMSAGAVSLLVAVYFVHRVWVRGPILLILPKEVFAGLVFAIGATLMGFAASNDLPDGLLSVEVAAFGLLCALNCLAISVWECDSDRDNDPNAIAQLWPGSTIAFVPFSVCLTVVLGIIALLSRHSPGFVLLAACAAGMLMIALLGIAARREQLSPPVLRVLADLAVLLPAVTLLPITPWAST